MIRGVGIDLVAVERIARLREKQGVRFLEKVFTPAERAYSMAQARPDEAFAARFAAKEAAMKALGTGWAEGVNWQDVEVVSTDGAPRLRFHGTAAERADGSGAASAYLSLSHDGGVAAAVVVLEEKR